jgi:hypothetical protein
MHCLDEFCHVSGNLFLNDSLQQMSHTKDTWGRDVVVPAIYRARGAKSVGPDYDDYNSALNRFSTVETRRLYDLFPNGSIGKPIAINPLSYTNSLGQVNVLVGPQDRPVPKYVPVVRPNEYSSTLNAFPVVRTTAKLQALDWSEWQ